MAQKDYIKRGNPKAKAGAKAGRNKAKNTKQVPDKKPLPVMAMSVVVLVLAGFSYFLWSINGASNGPQAQLPDAAEKQIAKTPVKAKSTTVRATQDQPDVPPPPKGEEWQYIDELKNKTVDVDLTKIKKKGPFLMQCATFKDPHRAEVFKAKLAFLGFESRIKVSKGANGDRHRVQLGPYEMNRDAQRARHKLSKHKINGCKIWLWS
jgi:cell division protein FtsN